MATYLDTVKNALRITVNDYDSELNALISAGTADIGLVGIEGTTDDALVSRAVITYVRLHFGTPDDYEHLKTSYDEQKAQLLTATGYGIPNPPTPDEVLP